MYFITMLEDGDALGRCVGYYKTFEEAEDAVKENKMDICESCYLYAVIENVPEGLYQYDTEAKWYKFNMEEEKYEEFEKPECFKCMVGFGIG